MITSLDQAELSVHMVTSLLFMLPSTAYHLVLKQRYKWALLFWCLKPKMIDHVSLKIKLSPGYLSGAPRFIHLYSKIIPRCTQITTQCCILSFPCPQGQRHSSSFIYPAPLVPVHQPGDLESSQEQADPINAVAMLPILLMCLQDVLHHYMVVPNEVRRSWTVCEATTEEEQEEIEKRSGEWLQQRCFLAQGTSIMIMGFGQAEPYYELSVHMVTSQLLVLHSYTADHYLAPAWPGLRNSMKCCLRTDTHIDICQLVKKFLRY